tara:strand:- start:43 stop:228 length:186 start_codon:yes stop_codon:yes gene_type:complete
MVLVLDGIGGVGASLRDLLRSQPADRSLHAISKARDEHFRIYNQDMVIALEVLPEIFTQVL